MVVITVDDGEVMAALEQLRQRLRDMTPVMRAAAQVVRNDAMEAFASSRSPSGETWKPLKAGSILSRAYRHAGRGMRKDRAGTLARFADAKPLLDTGALRNSVQVVSVGRDEAVIGSRLPYAAIHQFGGKAGRGRKASIPARPFLGLSEAGKGDLLDIVHGYLRP